MLHSLAPLRRFRRLPRLSVAALAAGLLSGCLTYETSETRVTFDRKSGDARIRVTVRNLASTESDLPSQWSDFLQLDSLRRSDSYFASAFLPHPETGRSLERRVWTERGRIHASYAITTSDLNQLAEGWSADTLGYRYTTALQVIRTNGTVEKDGAKVTVSWPRSARTLLVSEHDPRFEEAFPFAPSIRDSARKWFDKPEPSRARRPRRTTRR